MLTGLPNRVSALFADPIHSMFRDLDRTLAQNGGYSVGLRKVAPISVWSEGNSIYVEMDVPGIAQENLEVSLEKGQLTIKGKRPAPERQTEHVHEERFFGEFERHVTLGDNVSPDSVEASLRDGVLQVKVTRQPDAQRQKVTIQYGGHLPEKIDAVPPNAATE